MFKNRSFAVKMINDDQLNGNDSTRDPMEGPTVAAAYSEVAKDFITHAALTIGGVVLACIVAKGIFK